jgi:hypothetical protein
VSKRATPEPSRGVRLRLSHPVEDSDDAINMILTDEAKARAAQKRRHYEVDDPENFVACALAECLHQMSGADVLVMRRYVFVHFPGDDYTRRYQMDTKTAAIVKANDLDQLDTVQPNSPVTFRPPTPGRRLNRQGGPRVSKQSRGILANPPRPGRGDPYKGQLRNGVHANG